LRKQVKLAKQGQRMKRNPMKFAADTFEQGREEDPQQAGISHEILIC
jgi:hypothetical protein